MVGLTGWALYPTILAYQPGGDPSKVENKLALGLDLQGGMYLDMEVDTDAAVRRVLELTASELESTLLDELVDVVRAERVGNTVEIEVAAGEKVDWDKDKMKSLTFSFQRKEISPNLTRLEFKADEETHIRTSAVSQALEIIRNRVDAFGVAEPTIQKQGENSILIQLPGLKDPNAAKRLIGSQALLEFYLVEENVNPGNIDPTRQMVLFEEKRDAVSGQLITTIPYVVQKHPVMGGDTIRDARVEIDPRDNMPHVTISFDSRGTDRFAQVTRSNVNRFLAIVLDNKIRSAPRIQEEIGGGTARITGQFSMAEASELAITLRSGSLPAPIHIREERTVGATLGEDSIRQGLLGASVGAILVILFMLVYYNVSGLFATLALILNIMMIIATLSLFRGTLTLPGIAGLALTVGMAVDANVLIFERIREELAISGNPRKSVELGFQKAFWTIFDSNLTTLFAAFTLLAYGTGPIKGFAVTLSAGILISMFTAIVVTRFLFELFWLRRPHLEKISI
ncbi:MAG: protein translocase subunit SecD [Deltaproteobacteria bacterium]|nr:protein translocase subunit SecD [Deltaproteobacteria bacterium]